MKVIGAYFLLDLLVGVLIIVVAFQATNHFRHRRGREIDSIPPGFHRTDEVTIDPTTGIRMVVWYNEETGQRIYVPEPKGRH